MICVDVMVNHNPFQREQGHAVGMRRVRNRKTLEEDIRRPILRWIETARCPNDVLL
jgi:hypothetical protein